MTDIEKEITEPRKSVKTTRNTKNSVDYFKPTSFLSSGAFRTVVIFAGYACIGKSVSNRIMGNITLAIGLFTFWEQHEDFGVENLGLVSSLAGSTFVHLEYLFQCDTSQISFTMTLQWAGCLIGGLLCIATSNVSSDEPKMSFSLMLMAVTMILCTLYSSIYWFFIMNIIYKSGFAIYNSVSQSYVLHLWYNHRLKNPMTQTVHAVWSLFLALGPLIISPFLIDISDTRSGSPHTNASNITHSASPNYDSSQLGDLVTSFSTVSMPLFSHENETIDITVTSFNTSSSFSSPVGLPDVSMVRIAYIVLSLPLFVPAFIMFCIYLNNLASWRLMARSKIDNSNSQLTVTNYTNSKKYTVEESSPVTKPAKQWFLFLVIAFIILCTSIEITPRCFLTTFTAKYLGWSTRESTLINTIFSGCHFAGRIIGVPLSAVIRSRTLLVMNFVIITTASVLMLFSEWQEGILLWPAAGILGYGLSSTYAGFILWVSESVSFTTGMMAMAVISASIGGMLSPPLVGHLFDRFSPMWMAYVTLIAAILNIMIFIVLLVMRVCGTEEYIRQGGIALGQEQTVSVNQTEQLTVTDETIELRK